MKGRRFKERMYYQLLIILLGCISLMSFYINQDISFEQLDIKPETKNFEYSNGTLYYIYENSQIDFVFKYPSNWKLLELIDKFGSDNNVISIELKDSQPYNNHKNRLFSNYFNDFYQAYFPTLFGILSYELMFKNISIQEFAKIKNENLRHLFSDFKINIIANNINYIGRENIPAWKFEYSIENAYTSNELSNDKRNGLNIWILRGEKVYEIEYIANSKVYFKHLNEVTKLINSIRFR